MDWTRIILFYVVLLVSLVVHEAAHALFAKIGGDHTAYARGQVTLNPIPHIRQEPFGTVVLPLMALIMSKGTMCFGYASTPINPYWAHAHPRRAALMSAAGPLANVLLALLAILVMKTLIWTGQADATIAKVMPAMAVPADGSTSGPLWAACTIATTFVLLNALLFVFNLYPLPPLDGAGVVEGLLPRSSGLFGYVRSQPMLLLAGIVVVWYTVEHLWVPVVFFLHDLL